MSALISAASSAVAGRRVTSAKSPRSRQHDQREDVPVNEEGIEERARAIGDPAKGEPAKNGGEGFDFGFADVQERKRHGLEPERIGAKLAGVPEQDPAAEEKLPAEDLKEGVPGQVRGHALVVGLRRGIEFGEEPDDGRHQRGAAEGDGQSRAPVAEGEAVVARRFAKYKHDE